MSMEYLGQHFDVHTGGCRSHSRPPHQRDRARARHSSPTARRGVEWWLNGEFINLKGAKISNRVGAACWSLTLIDLGYHPLVYKGTSCFRPTIEARLSSAGKRWTAHASVFVAYWFASWEPGLSGPAYSVRWRTTTLDAFDQAVSDDLNTAKGHGRGHRSLAR